MSFIFLQRKNKLRKLENLKNERTASHDPKFTGLIKRGFYVFSISFRFAAHLFCMWQVIRHLIIAKNYHACLCFDRVCLFLLIMYSMSSLFVLVTVSMKWNGLTMSLITIAFATVCFCITSAVAMSFRQIRDGCAWCNKHVFIVSLLFSKSQSGITFNITTDNNAVSLSINLRCLWKLLRNSKFLALMGIT